MKIETVFEQYGYNINHSGRHTWDCWPNGMYIQLNNIKYENIEIDVYFSYETREVYRIEIIFITDEISYQWENPETCDAYIKSAQEHEYDMLDLFDKEYIMVDEAEIFDPVTLKMKYQ